MKKYIKLLTPPIIIKTINHYINKKYGWKGNYKNWQEAQKHATGYNTDKILKKVRDSLLKVKNGDIAYERDSVLFDEIQYSWPLLAGLMLASSDRLSILDFGGSLGSSYFQNKKFLDEFNEVSWSIVEQKHFVDIGRSDFEDSQLKFYHTINECIKNENPNILLLSSVLQYIEKPYVLLNEIIEKDFEYILMDRTIFSRNLEKDRITVQFINLQGYSSIPSWIFQENKMKKFFMKNYRLIEEYKLPHEKSNEKYEKGYIWKKI